MALVVALHSQSHSIRFMRIWCVNNFDMFTLRLLWLLHIHTRYVYVVTYLEIEGVDSFWTCDVLIEKQNILLTLTQHSIVVVYVLDVQHRHEYWIVYSVVSSIVQRLV